MTTTEASVDIIGAFGSSIFEWIKAEVLPVFYSVIVLTSIVLVFIMDGILIQSIRVNSRQGDPFHYLILHVACLDIIYASLLMTLGAIHSFTKDWLLHEYGCYIVAILFHVVFFMTFCYCVWQGLERTLRVASKQKWYKLFVDNNARLFNIAIAINYLVVIAVCCLPVPQIGIMEIVYYGAGYQCDYSPTNKAFVYGYFSIAFFIPFLVYLIYLVVITHVRRRQIREFVPDEADLLTGGLLSKRGSRKGSNRTQTRRTTLSTTHGAIKEEVEMAKVENANNSNDLTDPSPSNRNRNKIFVPAMPEVKNSNNSNNLDDEAGAPARYSSPEAIPLEEEPARYDSPEPTYIQGSEQPARYTSPEPTPIKGSERPASYRSPKTKAKYDNRSNGPPLEEIETVRYESPVPPLDLPEETPRRRKSRVIVARKTYTSVFEDHLEFHHAVSYLITWLIIFMVWIPYCATMFAMAYQDFDDPIWSGWYPLSVICATLSFPVKPIVYMSHNKHLNDDIKRIFSSKVLETTRAWQEKIDLKISKANKAMFSAPKPSVRGMKAVTNVKLAMIRWKNKLTSRNWPSEGPERDSNCKEDDFTKDRLDGNKMVTAL